jgi:hypothetical protein
MLTEEFYNSRSGGIAEPIKMLYRLFLINGAFVSEHTIRFDGPSRDDYIDELKIKSYDGTYTVDICIRRPIGLIHMNVSRQARYEPMFDLHGIEHLMRR